MSVMLAAGGFSPVFAARIKGRVVETASGARQVCSVIYKTAGEADQDEACTLAPGVTSLVVVEAGKKIAIRQGQDVILKARGTGKVMGKAIKVFARGADVKEILAALDSDGLVVVTGTDGNMVIIKPGEGFAPESGARVTIKTKQVQAVEGC